MNSIRKAIAVIMIAVLCAGGTVLSAVSVQADAEDPFGGAAGVSRVQLGSSSQTEEQEEVFLPDEMVEEGVLVGSSGDEGIHSDNVSRTGEVGGIGYHVNVDRTDVSNVVVIGDSRIVGMSMRVGRVSYNATVGAHFLFEQAWADREIPMIISVGLEHRGETPEADTGYYGEMVSLVRESMKKHGSCRVVIVATVNDADFYGWCGNETDRMLELGTALTEDGEVGGRIPTIYYMGMVPLKGKYRTEAQGYTTEYFNDYLAEQVKTFGSGSYFGIGDISDWDQLYLSDGIHFQPEGTQHLFDLILESLEEDP